MKKISTIFGVVSIVVLIAIVLIVMFLTSDKAKERKLEKELTSLATEFYEDEIKGTFAEDYTSSLGYYIVSLDDMKNKEKDVSKFLDYSCDLNETYAKLVFKSDDSFEVETKLSCQK